MSIKKCIFLLVGFWLIGRPGLGQPSDACIAHTKKALVNIERTAAISAYEKDPSWPVFREKQGMGFLVDKNNGYILTTKQVMGVAVVGSYIVTFPDNSQAEAKGVYYDPWLNFGFLQVDPTQIPADAVAIAFSTADPILQQAVFLLGNRSDTTPTVHTGQVAKLYTITGTLPQHTLAFNLDTSGGTSGSPVLNEQGEAIALYVTGQSIWGMGLHPAYIRYALQCLQQGKLPVRKHVGMIARLYALSDAVKHRNFPIEKYQVYNQQFPGSLGQAIEVVDTLRGSPADGKLLAGDLIWAIHGHEIGPSLVDLDGMLNKTETDQVALTICRNGQFQKIELAVYDLEATKIKRLLSWDGVVFFDIDDYISKLWGTPAQFVACCCAPATTIFNHLGYSALVAMGETPIRTVDDMIACIPHLIKKKYFTLDYISFLPKLIHGVDLAHRRYTADIAYSNTAIEPRLFLWDPTTCTWQMEKVTY